jgi:hypothetical protein
MDVDEFELAYLTARAEELGFEIFYDASWGFILRRIGPEATNPATHSNVEVNDLGEMLDGIEWGRRHSAAS